MGAAGSTSPVRVLNRREGDGRRRSRLAHKISESIGFGSLDCNKATMPLMPARPLIGAASLAPATFKNCNQMPRASDGSAESSRGANSFPHELGPCGGGDHGRIVGRKLQSWEQNMHSPPVRLGGETRSQFAVRRDAASDQNPPHAQRLRCCECLLHQIPHYRMLETGDEIQRLLIGQASALSMAGCAGAPVPPNRVLWRASAAARRPCSST